MEKDSSSNTRKITAYPFEETLQEIAAIAEQRQREKETDLQRRAMHIGSLFIAISEEAGQGGRYGTRSPEKLAELIRPYVVMAIDWLQEHGHPVRLVGESATLTTLLELMTRSGTLAGAPTNGTSANGASMVSDDKALLATAQPFMLDTMMEADLGIDDSDIL